MRQFLCVVRLQMLSLVIASATLTDLDEIASYYT